MKPMTNKNLYKFRSFAGFPVGTFFLILVLSSAATGRNARAEKISSVTFRNAVGALKNPIPAAFRGFQLCSFYPTLNNNATICTPNNPFTNPYWGVGRAPLGLTSTVGVKKDVASKFKPIEFLSRHFFFFCPFLGLDELFQSDPNFSYV
jgi:hypothetical protein